MLVRTRLGTEIRDRRINGTFVKGSVVLSEGGVVTAGNVDSVFHGGTLVRRTEAALRTGGLQVRGVELGVDNGALPRPALPGSALALGFCRRGVDG